MSPLGLASAGIAITRISGAGAGNSCGGAVGGHSLVEFIRAPARRKKSCDADVTMIVNALLGRMTSGMDYPYSTLSSSPERAELA
jgi:hypothetical protein